MERPKEVIKSENHENHSDTYTMFEERHRHGRLENVNHELARSQKENGVIDSRERRERYKLRKCCCHGNNEGNNETHNLR